MKLGTPVSCRALRALRKPGSTGQPRKQPPWSWSHHHHGLSPRPSSEGVCPGYIFRSIVKLDVSESCLITCQPVDCFLLRCLWELYLQPGGSNCTQTGWPLTCTWTGNSATSCHWSLRKGSPSLAGVGMVSHCTFLLLIIHPVWKQVHAFKCWVL